MLLTEDDRRAGARIPDPGLCPSGRACWCSGACIRDATPAEVEAALAVIQARRMDLLGRAPRSAALREWADTLHGSEAGPLVWDAAP